MPMPLKTLAETGRFNNSEVENKYLPSELSYNTFSGCWHSANSKYLYGIRNNMHIIDIASTEQHLWRALNVLSHLAYSGGSVLFVNNRPGYRKIVKVQAWILYNCSVSIL